MRPGTNTGNSSRLRLFVRVDLSTAGENCTNVAGDV